MGELHSALKIVEMTKAGAMSCREVLTAYLARIDETESGVKAWAFLDRDLAFAQADALDRARERGLPLGPLHGVPIGIKDIIDTAELPTECGSPILKGNQPAADANVVSRLREAGAIVFGKTVTTEFAFMHPSKTANPHGLGQTPGGSSAGSAAGVAAGQMPLSLGTQTNGSVIRPASFCGVVGFKPSRGMVSRTGILRTSATLDQVGLFARNLEDAAALADALVGYDASDEATYARPKPAMLEGCRADVPVEPYMAWFDLPYLDRMSDTSKAAFEELLEVLGSRAEKVPTPATFSDLIEHHRTIHEYEIWSNLKELASENWDQISPTIQPILTRAKKISDTQYEDAMAMARGAETFFAQFFNDFDAIIAPSSSGEAPAKDSGTGDPVFCTLWTLGGLPTLNLPILAGDNDLPIGVQLIGSHQGDDRLFRTANWLLKFLETPEVEPVYAGQA